MATGIAAVGAVGSATILSALDSGVGMTGMDNQRDNSEAGSARSSTSYDPTPVSFVMPSPIGLLGTNKKDDEASNWSQFAIAAANAGVGSSARATAR